MKEGDTKTLRDVLLEIEWLSRGKASRDTLDTINELARGALLPSAAAPSPARERNDDRGRPKARQRLV